jgi:hypothetical protein
MTLNLKMFDLKELMMIALREDDFPLFSCVFAYLGTSENVQEVRILFS